MTSWVKIAEGARLVASAVAKQTLEESNAAARRVSHHGMELSMRVRQTVEATQTIMNRHGNYTENTGHFQNNSDSEIQHTPPGPNPYESQLRKKLENENSSNILTENKAGASKNQSTAHINDNVTNPFLLHANGPVINNNDKSLSDGIDAEEIQAKSENATMNSTILPLETTAKPTTTDTRSTIDVESPSTMKEGRAVPSSRVGRAAGFAGLGIGLAFGTVSDAAGRLFGSGKKGSPISSDANADRLAATLCRMRGAALKMGQMLSIQDESLMPPALVRALNQVRQGADAMPNYQLSQQMESQLGKDWKSKFETFEDLPFAAASIGQVHRATLRNADGSIRDVCVKVQYPGVANSIESDLRNLTMLVRFSGLAPKGLFLENVVRVGRDELKVECNYINELANQQEFKRLVDNDAILQQNNFTVPDAVEELTTEQVIVSDYMPGGTIDKVKQMDQGERDRIGRAIMYLTMQELFVWRLMQTDPNWGNFLYDVGSQQTTLIDFGAAREYPKSFVDGYLRIVWANANRDEATLMDISKKMGFLTGEENEEMLQAHKLSGFTLGEPFATDEAFDFQGSRISTRMGEHTSVFLKHRLTPPPEEVYTLHRKLAGAFMLCIKLGAHVRCRDMLEEIVMNHSFEDGLPHPMQS